MGVPEGRVIPKMRRKETVDSVLFFFPNKHVYPVPAIQPMSAWFGGNQFEAKHSGSILCSLLLCFFVLLFFPSLEFDGN